MIAEAATLSDALKEFFGFDSFKGRQEQIIQSALDGLDTFVIMPTGGGKSMCYQLPALISDGTAIIISPLIALMKNQVDAIRNFGSEDGIAHFLNSSLSKAEITQVKRDITDGKTKMLYVAPESLTKQENIEFFRGIRVSLVAVDEAHCISEWGHDFRPEYRRIREMIKAIDQSIPIMALTATATPKVAQDIQKNLGMSEARVYKDSFNRSNLYYEVRPKVNVFREIIRFIKQNTGKSGIVYCLSRKKVEELANALIVNGIKALPYHAGMDAVTRADNQDRFLMEDADVIVATIAFGMGIDKPDVRFVIHHDIPKSLEGYYQETGRSGRDGGEGQCVAFYSYKDIEKLEKFMHGKPVAEQEVGRQLLVETVSFAETAGCRRRYLLHYFGEVYGEDNCSNCDNCLHPKEKVEASDEIVILLDIIQKMNQKFKAKHIVDVLIGKATSAVKSYKHHEMEFYAKGSAHDDKYWNAAIRQCLVARMLIKDVESYGLLKLTGTGRDFIASPRSFMLARDHDYQNLPDDDIILNQKASGGASDETLFRMLKDLTKQLAREKNLPPFVVFQEPSLIDMATQYPITMEELKNIAGVGQGKATKFGAPYIQMIKEHVEENDIERPQDMVVKSVVNKSGQKVFIIQSIDRKLRLDDIASAKGINLTDVIRELEHIVDSGTRVNIDYYIDDMLDEDHQDEIFEYFNEAETDSVKDALVELGEEYYSEEEVRLMRIKYISEVGN